MREQQGFYKHMTIMDNVKYCLRVYQFNKNILTESELWLYGIPMEKAIALYNNGLRSSDFQKLSILV